MESIYSLSDKMPYDPPYIPPFSRRSSSLINDQIFHPLPNGEIPNDQKDPSWSWNKKGSPPHRMLQERHGLYNNCAFAASIIKATDETRKSISKKPRQGLSPVFVSCTSSLGSIFDPRHDTCSPFLYHPHAKSKHRATAAHLGGRLTLRALGHFVGLSYRP